MRLMIIGSLNGELTEATKIAMDRGAQVTHAPTIDSAMKDLRSGRGSDLVMIEVHHDISELIERLDAEHIHVPVVACGIEHDAKAAVAAIQAGAKEYIPLPPDPELIAAILEAQPQPALADPPELPAQAEPALPDDDAGMEDLYEPENVSVPISGSGEMQ